MKKALCLILILSATFCLTACSSTTEVTPTSSDISEAASENVSSVSSTSLYKKKLASKLEHLNDDTESNEETKEESEDEREEESKKDDKEESEQEADENDFTFEEITVTLPDGFHKMDEGEQTILVPQEYPEVADNIFFYDAGKIVDDLSEESINKEFSKTYENFSGCRDFNRYEVDGNDVVSYSFDTDSDGVTLTQTQVACFLEDKTILIIITEGSGQYTEQFKEMIDSLRISN